MIYKQLHMLLCTYRPGGKFTLFMAKFLILFRTTSIPRASDALSSSTPSPYDDPSRCRARAWTQVVFPHPGGPLKIKFGMEHELVSPAPSAIARRRTTASSLPTTSSNELGLYFSTHGMPLVAFLCVVAHGVHSIGMVIAHLRIGTFE